MIRLCSLYLTDYCIILWLQWLYFFRNCWNCKIIKRMNKTKKDTMNNLTIDSNNQNQKIDSKLNINIILIISGDFFVKAYFRICENSVQTCCFDSKICLSRSISLHIKFHTFFYGKNSNLLYISNCSEVHNYKIQLIKSLILL